MVSTTTAAPAPVAPKKRGFNAPTWMRELVLLPVIVVVVILGGLVTPSFLTANNIFNNVLVSSAVLGMLVIAESLILVSGYIDLSLESIVGLAPALAVWLVLPAATGGLGIGLNPFLAMLAMFVPGLACPAVTRNSPLPKQKAPNTATFLFLPGVLTRRWWPTGIQQRARYGRRPNSVASAYHNS